MEKKSHFIVIEGLDGSGKSTASKNLANVLESQYGKKVKRTFEPNDDSVAGQFIRQILTKKISDFHPRILPLAFATNRLDHCTRIVSPWLATSKDHIVLCDRYYLSSLVYQSSEDFDMEAVYQLNEKAIRPDLILFFDVSDEICYQRMASRNEDRELFEDNLAATRAKFEAAKSFLIEKGETVIDVDASGTPEEVVTLLMKAITEHFEDIKKLN